MLWLAAYLTGFPPVGLHALSWTHGLAPMWSGLYIISTRLKLEREMELHLCVNALSGLYLISTQWDGKESSDETTGVNALSGLYLISTTLTHPVFRTSQLEFQCPLGLIPHFYGTPSKT